MNCNGGVLMSNKQNATLNITGMTCAACSNRIEKRLNKMDNVKAQVNLTTKKQRLNMILMTMQ